MIKIDSNIAEQIKGVEYAPNCFCNPVQDVNGYWFISSHEANALNIEGVESEYVAPIEEELNG